MIRIRLERALSEVYVYSASQHQTQRRNSPVLDLVEGRNVLSGQFHLVVLGRFQRHSRHRLFVRKEDVWGWKGTSTVRTKGIVVTHTNKRNPNRNSESIYHHHYYYYDLFHLCLFFLDIKHMRGHMLANYLFLFPVCTTWNTDLVTLTRLPSASR